MEAKSRGGAGRGQGRKAKDGAINLRQTAYRITQSQHEKVIGMGGSAWIRSLIDNAKAEPAPATTPDQPPRGNVGGWIQPRKELPDTSPERLAELRRMEVDMLRD